MRCWSILSLYKSLCFQNPYFQTKQPCNYGVSAVTPYSPHLVASWLKPICLSEYQPAEEQDETYPGIPVVSSQQTLSFFFFTPKLLQLAYFSQAEKMKTHWFRAVWYEHPADSLNTTQSHWLTTLSSNAGVKRKTFISVSFFRTNFRGCLKWYLYWKAHLIKVHSFSVQLSWVQKV